MNSEEFLKTIYLGDRGCKSILINSWSQLVAVQVTAISRIRAGSTTWDYNQEGDIIDGLMVFSKVRKISFEPSGPLPNDLVNDISVKRLQSSGTEPLLLFELSIGSVDNTGHSTEIIVRIEAASIHLEDPKAPGVKITT
jgi:hypothetical protein